MDNVYVIIVTYNGMQWYNRCFGSLQKSNVPLQIVTVDNASTDASTDYIKMNFPEVKLINSDKNLGFGQGNNLGIRYALDNKADYVFLLNQDAWIEPDTLEKLIDISRKYTEYGILSPIHLNAEKTEIEKGLMHYLADYNLTSPQLINDLYFNRLSDIYDTKYVNAAAWLLPRKTLEIVGGFDPVFYHYGEDDNYMQRVHYHGMKIGICPQITICHDTERREVKQVFLDNTSRTVLLTKLANINENPNLNKFIFHSARKAIIKFLKLNYKSGEKLMLNADFIMKHKQQIIKSRIQNKEKTNSWL